MLKYFTRKFRVRWSEINAIGQVDLSEYFRYVIETAWDWGAEIGLSINESEKLGLAWLIRETEINFYKPLYPNDIFDLTIWLVDWRRVRGKRCFEILLQDGGGLVAQGVQEVVVLDINTLRPVPPPVSIVANLKIENPREIEHRKFPIFQTQKEVAFIIQRDIEWRDLDSQGHVNNANYASFVGEATAKAFSSLGWSPAYFQTQGIYVVNQRAHIQYQSPALWGDKLAIYTYLMELKPAGGTWYIEIERISDRKPIVQCTINWSLANRISGEEQILPESLLNDLQMKVAIAKENLS